MDGTQILCKSCLSGDRKLSVIEGRLLDLFLYLSGAKPKIATMECIALCWECVALLKTTQRFRKRIRNAQAVFRSLHLLSSSKLSCLSTLSFTVATEPISCKYEESLPITCTPDDEHKVHDDLKYSYDECTSDILPKQENLDKYNVDIKDELDDDNIFSDTALLDVYIEGTDGKIDHKKDLTSEVSKEKKSIKIEKEDRDAKPSRSVEKRRKSKGNYHNSMKPKITLNTDLENLDKHCTRSYLNDEELNCQLNAGKKGKPKKFRCETCDKRFASILDQRMHETFTHLSLTTPPYECLQCKASVRSLPELESHWREHCYILRCNYCGMVIRKSKVMRRHLRSHSRVYRCRDCPAIFYSPADYRTHHIALHRKLTCDHCQRTFRSKQTISTHIRHLHLPNKCPHCPRVFPNYNKLMYHMPKKHGQQTLEPGKEELAYCVECDKQFPSVARYKVHVKEAFVHSKKTRKRTCATCSVCGKVFSRNQYMVNHYALHHQGSTRHHCALCDKYFLTAYIAKKHQLSQHEGVRPTKNKFCDICGQGFSTNRILTHHRRTHTGERPHACAHCGAAFAQRTALHTHQRTQHKLQQVKDEA